MAHHIIKSCDYVHIKEYSSYNYNYYRNKNTNEVILEICHEDYDYQYHNFGTNPTFTNEDFKTGEFMGFSYSCEDSGIGNVDVFEIDTEWT